jgi:hypothetical protein
MMLHHPAAFPLGAIAPVSFVWRPLSNPSDGDARQLWVWVHPSASAELLQCFHKIASQHEGKVLYKQSTFEILNHRSDPNGQASGLT